MEKFDDAAKGLLDLLWGSELPPVEAVKEFLDLLDVISDNAAARSLVAERKRLDQPLTRDDRRSAEAFTKTIYKAKKEAEPQQAKRHCLQQLDDRPFSIIAVLFAGEELLRYALPTIKALSEGAKAIAAWSTWPNDPELIDSLRQHRPAASIVTSNVAVQPSPSPVPCAAQQKQSPADRWVCSSCRTELRLECACKRATRERP